MEPALKKYKSLLPQNAMTWSLVAMTIVTWVAFPLMLKQLHLSAFHTILAIVTTFTIVGALITSDKNQIRLKPHQRLMLGCWIGYLLALLYATLESASTYSLVQWVILCVKFIFFIVLLSYINDRYIIATLRIYANLMVMSVIFAVIAVVLVVWGIGPLAVVDLGGRMGDVYVGTYYVQNTSICPPLPIYRIQGLSEEPGTFAFSLVPAFFWLLIVEKAYIRSAVLVVGLVLSMSLGVCLLLLMLLPILIWKFRTEIQVPLFMLTAICCIGLTFNMSQRCLDQYLYGIDEVTLIKSTLGAGATPDYLATYTKLAPSEKADLNLEFKRILTSFISTSWKGKSQSFADRRLGVTEVLKYLKGNFKGTGTALGMLTIKNSISVGYAVAALEAGIVGGVLYLCLFTVMGWQSLRVLIASKNESIEGRVKFVVALSVGSVLVMGTQRIQPDLSFWHMWIYAMWFYLMANRACPEFCVRGIS